MLMTAVIYDYNATEYLNKGLRHGAYLSRVSTRSVIPKHSLPERAPVQLRRQWENFVSFVDFGATGQWSPKKSVPPALCSDFRQTTAVLCV